MMGRIRKQGGTVRRLPSGAWQSLVDVGGGRRQSIGTFASESKAHAALRAATSEVDRGAFETIRRSPMFSQFAREVLDLRRDRLKPRTVKNWESLLNSMLLPRFSMVPIDQISIRAVDQWWADHAAHPVNRRNAYYVLKPIMDAGVRYGYLTQSPCQVGNAGAEVAKPRPSHTLEEFRSIVAAMPDNLTVPLLVTFSAHLRIGELVGLNASDYDVDSGILLVARQYAGQPTKTGSRKRIKMLREGRDALRDDLRAHPRVGEAPMFVDARGRRLSASQLRGAWNTACAEAQIMDFHIHDIRHVSLTLVGQTGASVKDLMARAGHSTAVAALRYQHASQERDAEVADLTDSRIDVLSDSSLRLSLIH
jgi:integrase